MKFGRKFLVIALIIILSNLLIFFGSQKFLESTSVETTTSVSTLWNRTLGGGAIFNFIFSTVENDFRELISVGGIDRSGDFGGFDAWIVKTDLLGNILWNRTFGGSNTEFFYDIVITENGDLMLAGTSSNAQRISNFMLIKTSPSGNLLWNQTFVDDTILHEASNIVETKDLGFVIAGMSRAINQSTNAFLLKTDSEGNQQWNQTIGGDFEDRVSDLIITDDNELIIIGSTKSNVQGDSDAWVVKTDSLGNVLWNQTFGGFGDDKFQEGLLTADGNLVLVGYKTIFDQDQSLIDLGKPDIFVVKIDSKGNLLWDQNYGGKETEFATSLIENPDGGFLILGETRSPEIGETGLWLINVDSSGEVDWDNALGRSQQATPIDLLSTFDGGIVVVGLNFGQRVAGFLLKLETVSIRIGGGWQDVLTNLYFWVLLLTGNTLIFSSITKLRRQNTKKEIIKELYPEK